jgi:hypothetical protein
MTPGFDQVIKKYMKKYNVDYRKAASILGKRKKKKSIVEPKKLTQGEFQLGNNDAPKYGDTEV